MSVAVRRAVRALLLDPEERLLLLCGHDPSNPGRSTFWFTVGGGLEPGEDPEVGLRREIFEEVGLRNVRLGPPVWLLRNRFTFNGVDYDQENVFYLARTDLTDIDRSGQEPTEEEAILEARWWRLEELRRTTDQLYPRPLVPALAALLHDGPPDSPLRLPDE